MILNTKENWERKSKLGVNTDNFKNMTELTSDVLHVLRFNKQLSLIYC